MRASRLARRLRTAIAATNYIAVRFVFLDLFARGVYNRNVDKNLAQMLPPSSLAFIGDAVYTLYMRRRIVEGTDRTVGTLHVSCSRLVNAGAQAAVFDALVADGAFTDEESEIARRAKNAHLHSRAKSATSSDYHKATALEAVIGYAELIGGDRVTELLALCAELSERV